MKTKMFEIRDAGTTIPVIAIKTDGDCVNETVHFTHAGWGVQSVILVQHNGGRVLANADPFKWRSLGSCTLFEAHRYIQENFDQLPNFAVIDVEFLLGETKEIKSSEILW